MTYPFPTHFSNEIINEFVGHECYSLIDGFSGYKQEPMAKEDQYYFFCEFGSFSYKVTPFGLKNAPSVFSRVVIEAF